MILVTKEVGTSIFQESYYDHIIRDEADYLIKWNYIDTNPARWSDDEYYESMSLS
jgi:putative transposase